MFENSVTYQYISNVTKGADGAITDVADLPEGSAAVVDGTNTILTIAQIAAANRVRIAQRINGMVTYSPYFDPTQSNIQAFNAVADQQQVSFLGYNGTDGALDATANATYTLGVILQHTAGVLNNSPQIKTVPYHNFGGTQAELALGLLTAFDRVMARENRQMIRCERVGDDQTGLNTVAETLAVTNGATGVTSSGAHTLATDDYVEIEGVVYQVTVTAATTFTLDSPYKGATDAAVAAADWGPATPVDLGLRFTGITTNPATFDAVNETFRLVEFSLSWDRVDAPAGAGADGTVVTYTTPAVPGQGTFAEVAVREVYTTMNEGNPFLSKYPRTNYRSGANAAATYRTYVINAREANYIPATTGQMPISLFNIYVCVGSTLANDILHFNAL